MPPILDIHDVTVFRGDTRVFDGFSLTLDQGQSTAVLGPNGAGKSTLLKLLSREVYPRWSEASWVRLFGRERWNIWDLRTRLGLVSHDLHVQYPDRVTGRDVVLSGFHSSLGLGTHHTFIDAERRAARAVIDRLEIHDLADRSYAAMSTGQQRRFLLGRALVHEPEVLVLDEPTSGLDLKASFHYLDTIRSLMRQGTTVVLATHHLHEIPPEIGRVVLLAEGRVAGDGPTEEMLTRERLSGVFGVPVEVVRAKGFHLAVPAETP